MGNNKQTQDSGNKSNTSKAKATAKPATQPAPNYLEQFQQSMGWPWNLIQVPKPTLHKTPAQKKKGDANQAGYLKPDAQGANVINTANDIKSREAEYVYGHSYDSAQTDCGRYLQETEIAMGDKKFPFSVPLIHNYMQEHGTVSGNIKDTKPGDYMIFSRHESDTNNTKNPSVEYAHAAIVTAVDTLNKLITIQNATLHGGNPGTLQPGYVSMLTGKRTDAGWDHNNVFKEVGRMSPDVYKGTGTTTTHKPASNATGNTNGGYGADMLNNWWQQQPPVPFVMPSAQGNNAPASTTKSPSSSTHKTSGGTHTISSPSNTSHSASTGTPSGGMHPAAAHDTAHAKAPGTGTISHPAGAQHGAGSGVTFHVQGGVSSHSTNVHGSSTTGKNNIHDSVVAILTSAVADSKIGIDIC